MSPICFYKTLHRLLKIHCCCQLKLKKTISIFILTKKLPKRIFKKIFNRLLLILDPFINNLKKIQNTFSQTKTLDMLLPIYFSQFHNEYDALNFDIESTLS